MHQTNEIKIDSFLSNRREYGFLGIMLHQGVAKARNAPPPITTTATLTSSSISAPVTVQSLPSTSSLTPNINNPVRPLAQQNIARIVS